MKTTLDIDDSLLIEAKAVSARRQMTLDALVEYAIRKEIQPTSSIPMPTASNDLIEISPYGLPRLKRKGTDIITTEMVRQLIDEKGN